MFLTGFMGSGKSSVGRALARRRGVPFVDLDQRIEAAAGRTIPDLFAAEGEAAFRRREARELEGLLAGDDDGDGAAVVATGGGTVAREGVAERLRGAGVVVWLDVPFAEVERRLGPAAGRRRPLFRDPETARRLYEERRASYSRCDLRITFVPGEGPEAVAARIQRELAARERTPPP